MQLFTPEFLIAAVLSALIGMVVGHLVDAAWGKLKRFISEKLKRSEDRHDDDHHDKGSSNTGVPSGKATLSKRVFIASR